MKPLLDEEVHCIVGRIYDGVAEPEALRDVLGVLACRLEAHSAVLFTPALPPDRGGLFVVHNHEPAERRQYCEQYFDLDVWWRADGANSLHHDSRGVIAAEPRERSGHSREHLQPVGTCHVIASNIHLLEASCAHRCSNRCKVLASDFPIRPDSRSLDVSLAFHGRLKNPGLDEDEKAALRVLVPHLRRALELAMRLAGSFEGVQQAVDALQSITDGIVLLAADGDVLHATQAARARLLAGAGLTVQGGRLVAHRARDAAELDGLIARAAGRFGTPCGGTVAMHVPHAEHPLIVSVFPLPYRRAASADANMARVLVVLRDPDQCRDISWDCFARYFSITPAELRLCRGLADDLSPAEYCVFYRISDSTVRTQLRSVFSKTGVRRQADLLKLIRAFG